MSVPARKQKTYAILISCLFVYMKNNLKLLIVALFLLTQTTLALNWAQMGSDIDGEAANDLSGNSLATNGTGNRVVGRCIDNCLVKFI